jgi:SpoIID/LytB domain protein
MSDAPVLSVGILSVKTLSFTLNSPFKVKNEHLSFSGKCAAGVSEGKVFITHGNSMQVTAEQIILEPEDLSTASFTLHDVTIGVNFHWERKEDQVFRGSLKLIVEYDLVTAINILSVEEYLVSVISSEMSASATDEFLKAHAVISRSWLLAQTEKNRKLHESKSQYNSYFRNESELIRWYDREDHHNFDVCADDHCQRYQGITRASSTLVREVINDTFGEILCYGNEICDARFYKCCGGVTELFENTWEPVNHPYLQKITDNPVDPEGFSLALENEEKTVKWTKGDPEAFCNTSDRRILSQVLNDYDQETIDFFRWKVSYTQDELSELVKTKTGIDFGRITGLLPVERGSSGRIIRLKITGTLKEMIIGKELEIRKALSESHLYSSCFCVEKTTNGNRTFFTLHGAGWGHGVGLCQIGAAVMGDRGYSYKEILMHYFRGAALEKRY